MGKFTILPKGGMVMQSLDWFFRRYNNEFLQIRAKNNAKLCGGMNISDFFKDILPHVTGRNMSFEAFYNTLTSDFQEMRSGRWYTYQDWSSGSKRYFEGLCKEFYKALKSR